MRGVPVYLDYNATTPVAPPVLEKMSPYWARYFANPASPHLLGKEAQDAVDQARQTIANLMGTTPQELVFTSGATEALNLAIQGVALAYESTPRRHILISATEHKAVLDPALSLAQRGWEVEVLPVTPSGLVEPDVLRRAIRPTTLLVAIMLANNETGIIQPIRELIPIVREAGAFFLCDTTQAAGKIPLSFQELDIDLAVLSAHKFYGPKGIGLLYVRRRSPRVSLRPLLLGGGHERGLRSGTLPVPLIVGMAAALEYALQDLPQTLASLSAKTTLLWERIQQVSPSARLNGADAPRLPNTLSVIFPGVLARELLARMPLVAVATGSACTSAKPEPSHVLLAMGLSPEQARATLRFSVGRPTTLEEIERAQHYLAQALAELKLAHR
ncbi:MAG: cysteine desulfurase [Bacteroidia bacterium]|nr:cysteine desulfurase [Bacteroidia bacterium]MDW8235664.1 cysteine desulfurase family protein [Bacteroidia bacterium]